MITAYIVIGSVSLVAVGGVILEQQLVKRDSIGSAELLSKSMEFTMKYGKFALIGYFLWRISMMF